jgi:hypothetical protein
MATALFEQAYVKGHSIMFWVAIGMMFLGLTEYSIKALGSLQQIQRLFTNAHL